MNIGHFAAKKAQGIQIVGQRLHAKQRQGAIRGLITDDATKGGRADDRTGGLGAKGKGHHIIRHRRGRARGGAARTMRRIMGIGGLARLKIGKFCTDRLAQHDTPRRPHQGDTGRITDRPMARIDGAAIGGGHVGGVDDVLYTNRQAGKRPLKAGALVLAPGGGQGRVSGQMAPGSDNIVPLCNARQTGGEQFRRVDPPLIQRLSSLGGG